MRKVLYNRCLDIKTHLTLICDRHFRRSFRGVTRHRREQNGWEQAARRVRSSSRREKPLARETRFDLIYASRPERARPTSIFEAPFVQLLMRPGHFIFTLRHAGARRGVRTNASRRRLLPAVLPYPDRFVPAYANRIASIREKETAKTREERFFHYTSAGVEQSSEK